MPRFLWVAWRFARLAHDSNEDRPSTGKSPYHGSGGEYAKEPFFHFVYHDGGLERLQNKLKLALLKVIRDTCATHNIQYIFSALSEDLPTHDDSSGLCPTPDEIVLRLDDSGDAGRLFKMGTF